MSYEEFTYFGKPVEEMTLEELMAERDVQAWAANRMREAYHEQRKRLIWLQNQEPLADEEELEKMYEDGEITYDEFKNIRKQVRKRRYEHGKAERAIVFAEMAEAHYKAVRVKCSEQIEFVRNGKPLPIRGAKARKSKRSTYDPRRKKVRDGKHSVKPIESYVTKWNRLKRNQSDFDTQLRKISPIKNWDYDRLLTIGFSRGYMSKAALEAAVAQELGITMRSATIMLTSGKMTWKHITTIGSLLEMTPAEFCDVFLYDYFKEVVDGKWVAD